MPMEILNSVSMNVYNLRQLRGRVPIALRCSLAVSLTPDGLDWKHNPGGLDSLALHDRPYLRYAQFTSACFNIAGIHGKSYHANLRRAITSICIAI